MVAAPSGRLATPRRRFKPNQQAQLQWPPGYKHAAIDQKGRSSMAEHTKYQQKIIRNYYQNQGSISLQKLGEEVTELYLAEGKARTRVWTRIKANLEKLKVPASRIEHLVKSDDPALLAKLLEELLAKQ